MDSKIFGGFCSRFSIALYIFTLFPLTGQACAMAESAVTLTTSDNYQISASLLKGPTAEGKSAPAPAVILVHQGFSNRDEWRFLFQRLVDQNYWVLAIDLRGHGKSQKLATGRVASLFNDPKQAPLDLKAAIDYLKGLEGVDTERIAVVGASLGANLAVAGVHRYGVKTAVAISGKTTAAQNLADSKELNLTSIYFVSSMEQQGRRAAWARELHGLTASPRKLTIVENSNSHGAAIFMDEPGLVDQVMEWLEETL